MGTLASESAASGSAAVQLRLGSSDGPHRKQAAASSAHSWQTAVAGGIAGATAKTFTAPLGRLTILYQVRAFDVLDPPPTIPRGTAGTRHYLLTQDVTPSRLLAAAKPPGLRAALTRVIREEGLFSLWKGNAATILHRLPYSSINFYTYETTKQLLVPLVPPQLPWVRQLAAGAVSGLVACTAAYPLDLVRTRLAAQTPRDTAHYTGIGGTLARVVAEEGVAGLYRGLGATLMQVVPSLALSFTVYETARATALKQQQWLQPQQRQHPPQTPPDTQSSSSSSSRDAASLEEQQMGERQASHALATTSGGSREGGTHRAASSPAGTMTSNTAGVGTSEDSTNMADRSSGSSSGGWWLWGRRPGPVRRALSSGQPLDEGDCIALQVGVSSSGREVVLHHPYQDEDDQEQQQDPQQQQQQQQDAPPDACGAARSASLASTTTSSSSASSSSNSNSLSAQEARRRVELHDAAAGQLQQAAASSGARQGGGDIPAALSLACGCVSGLVTSTVTFPLDVIRRRMQVTGGHLPGQRAPGYTDIIRGIVRQQGLRGFYVGIIPEYCKVVPGVAVAFCTYEEMKRLLRSPVQA